MWIGRELREVGDDLSGFRRASGVIIIIIIRCGIVCLVLLLILSIHGFSLIGCNDAVLVCKRQVRYLISPFFCERFGSRKSPEVPLSPGKSYVQCQCFILRGT